MGKATRGHDRAVVERASRHESRVQFRHPVLIQHGPVPRIKRSVALQGSDGRGDDPHRIRPVPERLLPGGERLSEPGLVILQDGVRNVPRPP